MSAAIIECLIRDEKDGESVRVIGKTRYRFRPDPTHDDAWIATVTDPDHIQRFLGVPEGYRLVQMLEQTPIKVEAAPLGLGIAPEPKEPVAPAPKPEPVQQQVTEAAKAPEPTPQTAPSEPQVWTAEALAVLDDDKLRDAFRASVGRAPSSRAGRETMIAQIIASAGGAA